MKSRRAPERTIIAPIVGFAIILQEYVRVQQAMIPLMVMVVKVVEAIVDISPVPSPPALGKRPVAGTVFVPAHQHTSAPVQMVTWELIVRCVLVRMASLGFLYLRMTRLRMPKPVSAVIWARVIGQVDSAHAWTASKEVHVKLCHVQAIQLALAMGHA